MLPPMEGRRYIVAIVGGATAGAEAAGLLAERGVVCVVFEQNPRPYGKIEDGLPRWHVKLRQKEYELINQRLDRPGVHFVPSTKIGADIDFRELCTEWGFTSVILAHGAWRDRPLALEGADAYLGRGLLYQNAFIHWFNHFTEKGYRGPQYQVHDGTIVVGGGLASIDVMKVLQLESARLVLEQRGIREDMLRLEHAGIPAVLSEHGLHWKDLGLRGATLYYRRRIEDMPLAEVPDGADPERVKKFESVRRRILEKAMEKYAFAVQPLRLPVGLIVEQDCLAGLRFQHTRVENGRVEPIAGTEEEVRAPLVISSIGSVPEPMPGIQQRGELYDYVDRELGRLAGHETVFSTGNVVTGKGNIAASRRHSVEISTHVIESFLGVGAEGHAGEEELLEPMTKAARETAAKIASQLERRPLLSPAQVGAVLERVRRRQQAVGYRGSYREWLQKVTPLDLA
jgi:ferredoxin--NADP+ reductase